MSKSLLCRFTVIYREQASADNYCDAEKWNMSLSTF